MATRKYMLSSTVSSVVCIIKVNRGSIKKKFHINALNVEAMRTGIISKTTARKETHKSKIKATIL